MKADEKTGIRPLYRPRNWNEEERNINKKKKRHNWSTKGGYVAPIMVPSTPGGELYKILKEVAEKEAAEGGGKVQDSGKGGKEHKRDGTEVQSNCYRRVQQ